MGAVIVEEVLVSLENRMIEVLDDVEFRCGCCRAERVIRLTFVGRAKQETIGSIGTQRVQELTADKFTSCDEGLRRIDVRLNEGYAINRGLEFRSIDVIPQRDSVLEQSDTKALATTVVLGDEWPIEAACCCQYLIPADGGDGTRSPNAMCLERCVLGDFADLELQRTARVNNPPPMAFQPG